MLTDNQIEELGEISAKAYKDSTDEDGFLEIMLKSKYYNVQTYIFKHHYAAISAHDLGE